MYAKVLIQPLRKNIISNSISYQFEDLLYLSQKKYKSGWSDKDKIVLEIKIIEGIRVPCWLVTSSFSLEPSDLSQYDPEKHIGALVLEVPFFCISKIIFSSEYDYKNLATSPSLDLWSEPDKFRVSSANEFVDDFEMNVEKINEQLVNYKNQTASSIQDLKVRNAKRAGNYLKKWCRERLGDSSQSMKDKKKSEFEQEIIKYLIDHPFSNDELTDFQNMDKLLENMFDKFNHDGSIALIRNDFAGDGVERNSPRQILLGLNSSRELQELFIFLRCYSKFDLLNKFLNNTRLGENDLLIYSQVFYYFGLYQGLSRIDGIIKKNLFWHFEVEKNFIADNNNSWQVSVTLSEQEFRIEYLNEIDKIMLALQKTAEEYVSSKNDWKKIFEELVRQIEDFKPKITANKLKDLVLVVQPSTYPNENLNKKDFEELLKKHGVVDLERLISQVANPSQDRLESVKNVYDTIKNYGSPKWKKI
jgi:hypothetical protein